MTETPESAFSSGAVASPPIGGSGMSSDNEKVFEAVNQEFLFYSTEVKYWIDLVELYFDGTPDGLAYEVRAFTGHLSDAITRSEQSLEERIKNVENAHTHLRRILLDCLKLVGIWQRKQIHAFDKKYRWSDLSDVNNGHFREEYSKLKKAALACYDKAKVVERPGNNDKTDDPSKNVYTLYLDAYNANVAVLNLLDENDSAIERVAHKDIRRTIFSVLGWAIGIAATLWGIFIAMG